MVEHRTTRTRRWLCHALLTLVLVVAGCACSESEDPSNLSEAVASGDPVLVQDFIDRSQSLEEPRVFGFTPLMRAVNRDDVEVAEVLIEAGADVDGQGRAGMTPVHIAARSDAVSSLSLLLTRGADPIHRSGSGLNSLDHAADAGAVEVLDILLARSDLHIDEPSRMVTQGHGYPRDMGPTPLGLAVRGEHLETVRRLLELGADVNGRTASGHTPLLLAVFFDVEPEIVELLIEFDGDPGATAVCELGCSVPGEPFTVKEWAKELNREELLPLLNR